MPLFIFSIVYKRLRCELDLELHTAHDHMDLIQNVANSWMEDDFQDNNKLRINYNLAALQYDTNPQIVHVPIKHFNINTRFTVPTLTGWFDWDIILSSANVYSDGICTGLHPTKFIVICAHISDGCSSHGCDNCELLIFRRAITGNRMINLKSTDVKYMCVVANWYASISNLAPQSNKLAP
jgi:hypothetical protein